MTRIFIAAAAFAAFAITSAAQASTATIQVGNLDLTTAEGQATLQARIESAARKVCSAPVAGSRILRIDESCATKARASVEQQVAARRTVTRNGG
jgi:UrcA family protein